MARVMTQEERIVAAIGHHGIHDLDVYGLVAVDKTRLDALEQMFEAHKAQKYCVGEDDYLTASTILGNVLSKLEAMS